MSDTGVRDARDGPPEEYWDRFLTMLGSEGLITYWYLGRAFNQDQDPDTMRLRRDMRNPAGGVLAVPPGFRPIDLPPDIPDTDQLPPLHVVFGARRDADGWRLPPLAPRLASTSASLHLGPIHVAFEAAAMEAATARAGADARQAEGWDIHFAAPGTIGPFLVGAEALAGRNGGKDRVGVRLTLVDEGRDRRVVATGVAVYRIA